MPEFEEEEETRPRELLINEIASSDEEFEAEDDEPDI